MSARPCPINITCPGDSVTLNLSSEAPDPFLWYGVGWSPYRPTPILFGPPQDTVDCSSLTFSDLSQEMADLLAQIASLFCPTGNDPNGQEFTNAPQTASIECPNGSRYYYTIPSGSILSGPIAADLGAAWVAYANNWALAKAYQSLIDSRVCLDVPGRPKPKGPLLSANPGWICAAGTLGAEENTYKVTGKGTYAFEISSAPPGTALVQTGPRTAVLQGTPSVPGVYTYTITATSTHSSVSVSDTLYVFGLTTTLLSDGVVGSAYYYQLVTGGNAGTVTFEPVGALPEGLSLSSTGLISGTPTTVGDYDFGVNITDYNGDTCTEVVTMEIVSGPDPSGPDWDGCLTWDARSDLSLGIASASGSGSGSLFTLHGETGLPAGAITTVLGADCYYTGDPFTLNLNINTSVQSGYNTAYVRILFNGVALVNKDESDFATPGSYNFQYDTTPLWGFITALGDPVHIHVSVVIIGNTSVPHPDASSLTFTGTLTNI